MKPQTTTKKDDFFDAFNDNFTTKKSSTINPSTYKSFKQQAFDTSGSTRSNNNFTATPNTNAFGDPFGDKKYGNESKTGSDFTAFDDFNDNFSEMKLSSTTDNITKGFAAFDAFNNNNGNVLKTSNLNSSNNSNRGLGSGYAKPFIKSPLKMQDTPSKLPPINISKMDFSKEDTFDLDLAAVLERIVKLNSKKLM